MASAGPDLSGVRRLGSVGRWPTASASGTSAGPVRKVRLSKSAIAARHRKAKISTGAPRRGGPLRDLAAPHDWPEVEYGHHPGSLWGARMARVPTNIEIEYPHDPVLPKLSPAAR